MEGDRAARSTRRQVIAVALAVGGGVLARGVPAATAAVTPPMTDTGLLAAALAAEEVSLLAYRFVLGAGMLPAHAHHVVHGLYEHERAHIATLQSDLAAVGGVPPSPPTSETDVATALSKHKMSSALAMAKTEKDALQLLLDVESLCEGAYYTAIGGLRATGPLVHAAQALAGEAQHSTLIAGLLYKGEVTESVPYWYVAGVT
jgi:hypothetical protein